MDSAGSAGTFSGTVTTNQMQVFSGSVSSWNVTSVVLPLEWQNSALSLGTPLQWFDKVGRWRWSKPDKDTLVEALRFLKKQAE